MTENVLVEPNDDSFEHFEQLAGQLIGLGLSFGSDKICFNRFVNPLEHFFSLCESHLTMSLLQLVTTEKVSEDLGDLIDRLNEIMALPLERIVFLN